MQVLHVQQRMLTVHIDLQSSLSSPSLLPGSVAAMCASTHTWSSVSQAAGQIKPGLCHMLPTIHYYPAIGSEPVTSINMAYIQMCDWCPQAVVEWIHLIHLIHNLFCPATYEREEYAMGAVSERKQLENNEPKTHRKALNPKGGAD